MTVPARATGRQTAAQPLWALVLVGVLLVGLVPAAQASADHSGPRARLAEVQRQARELEQRAEELEREAAAAEERFDQLGGRLDQAAVRLESASAREAAAEQLAEDARGRAQRAARDVVQAELELGENEQELAAIARRTYVHGRSSIDPLMVAISTTDQDAGQLAARLHLLERTIGVQAEALESATALTVRLAALREQAVAQRRLANRSLRDAEAATNAVAATHAEVLALTDEASRMLSDRQQQLDTVAAERQQLAEQAAVLAAAAREQEQAARAAAEATASAQATAARAAPPSTMAPLSPIASSGPSDGLVTVRGITVAASLGPALEALLAAAAADGILLGGSGYRSPEVTARLRVANGCPDTYDAPASSCRIPTAPPGTSEHEKGLAVDFTWQGQTICYPRASAQCTGNAAFEWLRANAVRFGFRNLPSEAWHWSTSGR
ncbi:MAG: D-alanyl-D-alanine carboxypeptidase family protein [Nitriliruptoraceae bacterium]